MENHLNINDHYHFFKALKIAKLLHPAATPVSTMLNSLNFLIKKYKSIKFPPPPSEISSFESFCLASFSIKSVSSLTSSYNNLSIDLQNSSVECLTCNLAQFVASIEVSFSNLLIIFLKIEKSIFYLKD